MEKRIVLALASISTILLASFALVAQIPSVSAQPENHLFWMLAGTAEGCSDLVGQPPTVDWKTPFQTRPPDFMPLLSQQNITFSNHWTLPGYGMTVNLTVPYETYVGLDHAWYDKESVTWYRLTVTLEEDGYGWIFLNATGDVDIHTFNNDTGVWWTTPSPFAGIKAADSGAMPDPGLDGVAGTADDGFGDGTNDTRGSSILMIPSKMHVDYWGSGQWNLLFESPWPQVFTTETAYDIVNEPNSELDGWNKTKVGQPWEFYAGLDQPGKQVNYGHPKWNAYVTYVCAWSVINQNTMLGDLDVIFAIMQKAIRDDCVIADVNGDWKVTITDIVIAALAFGAEDEGPGGDGTPNTGDDKPDADPNYDARGDFKPTRGKITISDIVRIALDFGAQLTPDCIIRP